MKNKNNSIWDSKVIDGIAIFLIAVVIFFLGYFIAIQITYNDSEENTVGFYFSKVTVEKLENLGRKSEYKGEWVCIDANDMDSVDKIVKYCSHEVAHHLYKNKYKKDFYLSSEEFAEFCEDDIYMCLEKFGDLK